MTVKELKEQLLQIPDDAVICVEAFMDPMAQIVKYYEINGEKLCYIGDDLEQLEFDMFGDENDEP